MRWILLDPKKAERKDGYYVIMFEGKERLVKYPCVECSGSKYPSDVFKGTKGIIKREYCE